MHLPHKPARPFRDVFQAGDKARPSPACHSHFIAPVMELAERFHTQVATLNCAKGAVPEKLDAGPKGHV